MLILFYVLNKSVGKKLANKDTFERGLCSYDTFNSVLVLLTLLLKTYPLNPQMNQKGSFVHSM